MGAHIVHELSDVQVVDEKEGIAYLHAAVEVRRTTLGHARDHSALGTVGAAAQKSGSMVSVRMKIMQNETSVLVPKNESTAPF